MTRKLATNIIIVVIIITKHQSSLVTVLPMKLKLITDLEMNCRGKTARRSTPLPLDMFMLVCASILWSLYTQVAVLDEGDVQRAKTASRADKGQSYES